MELIPTKIMTYNEAKQVAYSAANSAAALMKELMPLPALTPGQVAELKEKQELFSGAVAVLTAPGRKKGKP